MLVLVKKSLSTLVYEGPSIFLERTRNYLRRSVTLAREKRRHTRDFKDVLFINGCTLSHPTRFRVEHQVEQLHFNGYSCDSVFYESLIPDRARYYRAFVFFRCPHTPAVETFIGEAKKLHKPVFFDIDDLVIDDKYVDTIQYLKTMSTAERRLYYDGVHRMQRTLRLCDAAITTTPRLADELAAYVPQVFVNRNVASEHMVKLSHLALERKSPRVDDSVMLGYFSGSITHNDDFKLIVPTLLQILERYPKTRLKIVGLLDLPPDLQRFAGRVIAERFADWRQLPQLLASVDINLAPLEQSIFNEAKSENRWLEASLVGVPTVASDVGAVAQMATHGATALLCKSEQDWFSALASLIESHELRAGIGAAARRDVLERCITAHTASNLGNIVRSKLPPAVAFVVPSTRLSGGINVVMRHASILQKSGMDVNVLSMDDDEEASEVGGIPSFPLRSTHIDAFFDRGVATLWSTLDVVNQLVKVGARYYLVQNYETDFYTPGDPRRIHAALTYNSFGGVAYITISKWCQDWLAKRFGKTSVYAPNGLDLSVFAPRQRDFSGRLRVLVEGNSDDHYKNVDESFLIANRLDPRRFEIWYLSYQGKPKTWYRVDRFLHRVPYAEVAAVYQACHVLLKSSILESFSYPPLEMMATGGVAVVAPNAGNAEYLRDRENCLLYRRGEPDHAVKLIEEVCRDAALRARLVENGLATSRARDWKLLEADVRKLYGFQ